MNPQFQIEHYRLRYNRLQFLKLNQLKIKIITEKIKIFPNPTSTYLYIEHSENEKYKSFFCFDMTGKNFTVPYEIYDNRIRLDISGLKPGVYGIILYLKNKIYTSKFIIINHL